MGIKPLSETPVLMAEIREVLESNKGDLNFRAQKTLEHLQQFTPLSKKKALELFEELKKLEIPRLREQHLIKLVDILPTTEADVKVVLQGFAVTVTGENMKKVAETILPYTTPK